MDKNLSVPKLSNYKMDKNLSIQKIFNYSIKKKDKNLSHREIFIDRFLSIAKKSKGQQLLRFFKH
jgi:hypothetical protein